MSPESEQNEGLSKSLKTIKGLAILVHVLFSCPLYLKEETIFFFLCIKLENEE